MAGTLPPPPTNEPPGSFAWMQWFNALQQLYSVSGSIPWALIDTAGSDITDIATRPHNSLTTIQGGAANDYYHLTLEQYEAATGADDFILPKTSGKGIRVEPAAPTFPWHDLLGAISIRGAGATDPAYNVYNGSIRGYQFAVNDEVFVEFHIPHDYLPGSNLFIHAHWSQRATTKAGAASGTVTGGTVTWAFEICYAKGHQQAAFSSTVTPTVQQVCNTTTRYHHIAEVQVSASTPSGTQIDTDDIEVDGVILCRAYLSANNITVSAGSVPAPFLHFVDIHYQSTGVGTKQKAPSFYT